MQRSKGYHMNKTVAGCVMVAGPLVAWFGADISAKANNQPSTPDTDWYYSMLNGVGGLMILAGLVMFFYGAMRFARKTA